MAIDSNWARWIRISIADHFNAKNRTDTALQPNPIPLYFEGQIRSNEQDVTEMELRLDGPHIHEVSKNYYKISVEPNLILKTPVNEADIWAFDRVIGLASAMFDRCIAVFRYGNGVQDDETFVFDLKRVDDPETLTPYGQVDGNTRLMEGSVSANYRGYITVQE